MSSYLIAMVLLSGVPSESAGLEVLRSDHSGLAVELSTPPSLPEEVRWGLTPWAAEPGAPVLAKAGFLLAVPASGGISITTLIPDTVSLGVFSPTTMPPSTAEDASAEQPPPIRPESTYPAATVQLFREGVIRGVSLARVNVIPYSWDPVTGELLCFPTVRVRLDFEGGLSAAGEPVPGLESVLAQKLINGPLLSGLGEGESIPDPGGPIFASAEDPLLAAGGAHLMIVCGGGLEDEVEELAWMRYRQGYLTAVVDGSGLSSQELASLVQEAYDSWDPAPSHLLLVGDSELLPAFYSESTGVWTDNRYACVDGDDFMADILCGRLPVTAEEAPDAIGKLLAWETAPSTDPGFWSRALLASAFQDADGNAVEDLWFCFTSETLAETLSDSLGKEVIRQYIRTGPSSQDPLYYRPDLPATGEPVPDWMPWEGTTGAITHALNIGVFLAQHRAHGYTGYWAGPIWGLNELPYLDNADRTPIVLSINCHTGNFLEECLAEALVAMEGGAVCAIAATGSSYSYWNDYLCYGMYMGFLGLCAEPPSTYTQPQGAYSAGAALLAGKLEMQASAPGCPYPDDKTEEQWDLYHVLGDPLMDMRSRLPIDPVVDCPDSLPVGSGQALFRVRRPSGEPVPGALVCLRKPDEDIYARGLTDSSGYLTLSFPELESATEMPWYVSGHDLYPEEGAVNSSAIRPVPAEEPSLYISPNPSAGILRLRLRLPARRTADIRVYDLSGRVVCRLRAEDSRTLHELSLDLRHLPSGVYTVRADAEDLRITAPLIILN